MSTFLSNDHKARERRSATRVIGVLREEADAQKGTSVGRVWRELVYELRAPVAAGPSTGDAMSEHTGPNHCSRCHREAPAIESSEYATWEATYLADGELALICPGCLTSEEHEDIATDMDDLARRARDEEA